MAWKDDIDDLTTTPIGLSPRTTQWALNVRNWLRDNVLPAVKSMATALQTTNTTLTATKQTADNAANKDLSNTNSAAAPNLLLKRSAFRTADVGKAITISSVNTLAATRLSTAASGAGRVTGAVAYTAWINMGPLQTVSQALNPSAVLLDVFAKWNTIPTGSVVVGVNKGTYTYTYTYQFPGPGGSRRTATITADRYRIGYRVLST